MPHYNVPVVKVKWTGKLRFTQSWFLFTFLSQMFLTKETHEIIFMH